MKVKDLKQVLASLDDDVEIILSQDEEGNIYREAEDVYVEFENKALILYPNHNEVSVDNWMARKVD